MTTMDRGLISSVVTVGPTAMREARELGVTSKIISDDQAKKVWDWLVAYVATHGDTPSPEIVTGIHGYELPLVKEPASWWIGEVCNRALYRDQQTKLTEIGELMTNNQPVAALEAMEVAVRTLRKQHAHTRSVVVSVPSLFPDVLKWHDDVAGGKRGIPTPWSTWNEETLGMWPEDFSLLVGKKASGKSWSLLVMALHAWAGGCVANIVSTELSRLTIAMRLLSIKYRIDYRLMRRGMIPVHVRQKIDGDMADLLKAEGLYVSGGNFEYSIPGYEASVFAALDSPGASSDKVVSYLDGLYLFKGDGKDRTEKMANVYDGIKHVGKKTCTACVATTQFNRTVKEGQSKTVSSDGISTSDAGSFNADVIYGINRTPAQKKVGETEFLSLKMREALGLSFRTKHDLRTMEFDEIADSATEPGAEDGDEGSGGAAKPTKPDLTDLPF